MSPKRLKCGLENLLTLEFTASGYSDQEPDTPRAEAQTKRRDDGWNWSMLGNNAPDLTPQTLPLQFLTKGPSRPVPPSPCMFVIAPTA
ncbi:hypothetical protein NQZ68_018728 [Dissostichus eleginoides]|nr:hypothetical protein NQZ68_018728 [Dissostichus eleginoides]